MRNSAQCGQKEEEEHAAKLYEDVRLQLQAIITARKRLSFTAQGRQCAVLARTDSVVTNTADPATVTSSSSVRRRNHITQKLEDLHAPTDSATVEIRGYLLRNLIQVLGRERRQHQDWIDNNDIDIKNLLVEKNRLLKAYMVLRTDATEAAFFRYIFIVQKRLREMHDVWLVLKLEEIPGSVLHCSSAISNAAINRLPLVDTNNDPDMPPSLQETIRTVQQISSGKAPESNAIPPEVYKPGWPRLMVELATLLQEMWRRERFPQDFKDATIFYLFKRKGNRLWKITQTFGCPKWFRHMVHQLQNAMMAHVTDNWTVFEAFVVTNGVHQGCVLALTVFSLILSAMLMDMYRAHSQHSAYPDPNASVCDFSPLLRPFTP
ncbi:unnamed protein product [Schistocephalus solidus]|uniref:Reverse transcriptase domain-containing protein n=1 Tax=Schistocephalus solidus TaxID=70667 RepID=A0A183SK56_SCHSO|nr:unnamed protein product [Schistocephalus solidus]